MRFSKKDNIYKVIRITGTQDNILGISFGEEDVEVIEKWTCREALSVIKGEILGYWTDSYRTNYGQIRGVNFEVKGHGKFINITHVEMKNAVGSKIFLKTDQCKTIYKKSIDIGKKSFDQKELWSNSDKRERIKGYDPSTINSSFLQTPDNVLTAVCLDDVPEFEQPDLIEGLKKKETQFVSY